MPDPVIGPKIVTSALGAAGSDVNRAIPSLINRMLGPAADEIGEALRRYTGQRVGNVERIVKRASAKSDGARGRGAVHPRVAHAILEDGSYCDDELMAEYYGGVLAASRTPTGRDDRAISWSALVASMSSVQIRAHYLLYREWAARLHGVSDLYLGYADARARARTYFELSEFIDALASDSGLDAGQLLSHAIVGLNRTELLDHYSYGQREVTKELESPFPNMLCCSPSVAGLELYGWAQGLPGMSPYEFISKARVFDIEDAMPRLVNVAIPHLATSYSAGLNSQFLSCAPVWDGQTTRQP
jgi:hypothetical protein